METLVTHIEYRNFKNMKTKYTQVSTRPSSRRCEGNLHFNGGSMPQATSLT